MYTVKTLIKRKLDQQYYCQMKQPSEQRGSLHKDKVNLPRRHNAKCAYSNNRAASYMKQKLVELKGEVGKSTITVGDVNIFLSRIDRPTRQKISKDIKLNNTINQSDCNRYLWNTSPNKSRMYILFKCTQNIYQGRPYFGAKNKFKRTETIECVF